MSNDPVSAEQTPVTMQNAVQFGFKVGLGIVGAQLAIALPIALIWLYGYIVMHR